MLVAGRNSASGHPLMVAGPQVAYFNPQILMEQDVHAPGVRRPARRSTRAAPSFIGVNLYVQLGRGRDYAWSATSAGQDIIDTYAMSLCEPGGGKATLQSMHYRYRGSCLPIEVLEKTNSLAALPRRRHAGRHADAARRAHQARARGRPRHGARQAGDLHQAALDLLPRGRLRRRLQGLQRARRRCATPPSFQRAASKIGYAFNWFYADPEHIAYFNSGANPVRAKRVDHAFPVRARRSTEWKGWNPDRHVARASPRSPSTRRRSTSSYLVSWNNKQARGFAGPDENVFSSAYRSLLLEDRAEGQAARRAQADAAGGRRRRWRWPGTGDLRAHVGAAAGAAGASGARRTRRCAQAVGLLQAWRRAGGRADRRRPRRRLRAQRRDPDHGRLVAAVGARRSSSPGWARRRSTGCSPPRQLDNAPNNHGDHLGSAYQGAWYGYVRKDLRTVLGRKVKGRYVAALLRRRQARSAAGRGCASRCGRRSSVPASALYGGDEVCKDAGQAGDQSCFDAVRFRPVGGATQPLIPWINRPDLPAGQRDPVARAALERRQQCGRVTWVETASETFVARHDERDARRRRARARAARVRRASGSSAQLEVELGELAVVLHGSPAQLDAAQPWIALQRRLTAPAARRYVVGWAGERELHVLSPRLLAQRASNVEGSLEMLMLAPSALLARHALARRPPRLPAAARPAAAARAGCAAAWFVEGARAVALGPDAPRAARRSRGGCARARAPAFPPKPRRRAAARRHGVRPARARGGRARRGRRPPAAAPTRLLADGFHGRGVRRTEDAWRSHLARLADASAPPRRRSSAAAGPRSPRRRRRAAAARRRRAGDQPSGPRNADLHAGADVGVDAARAVRVHDDDRPVAVADVPVERLRCRRPRWRRPRCPRRREPRAPRALVRRVARARTGPCRCR